MPSRSRLPHEFLGQCYLHADCRKGTGRQRRTGKEIGHMHQFRSRGRNGMVLRGEAMVHGTIDISTRLDMITVPKPNACHDSTSFCIGGRDSNPSERAKTQPSSPVAMLAAC